MFKKIFFLFLFIFSCTSSLKFYEKTGFSDLSNNNKIVSTLPKGSLLKITNMQNKISKIVKTEDYQKTLGPRVILLPDFIYNELDLNKKMPLINIQSVRENKTFIAKKIKTYKQERKVQNKIRIEKVNVLSLNSNNTSKNKIYLNYGPFYFKTYAESLYKIINLNIRNKKIIFKDYKEKNYIVSIGPLKNIKEYDEMYLNLSKIGLSGFNILVK